MAGRWLNEQDTGDASIVGSGSSQTAGSGTLTRTGPLAGAGATASAGSATLTATSPSALVGAGATASAGSATLTLTAAMIAAGATASAGVGTLTLTAALTGAGATQSSGNGSLSGAVPFSGAGSSITAGSATLAAVVALGSATGATTSAGVGTLQLTAALVGAGASNSAGSATLSAAGVLTASGASASAGSATLTGSGPLVGSGASLSAGSATLSSSSNASLTGAGATVSTGSGTLSGNVPVVGAGATTSVGAGTLSGSLPETGAGASGSAGSATLSVSGPLTGAGATVSAGSGTLGGNVPVVGAGASVSAGLATLSGTLALTASGQSLSTGSAALLANASLAASGAAASAGSGTLTLTAALVGSGDTLSAGLGTLSGGTPVSSGGRSVPNLRRGHVGRRPVRIVGRFINVVSGPTPESVFQPLSVMSVVNPMNFSANNTGSANTLTALQNTAAALPAGGGIIYFPPGTYRKDGVWNFGTKPVKLWAPNRQATLFGRTGGAANVQATRWVGAVGVGVFGLKFTSDATVRGAGELANQVTWTNCDLCEMEGAEIDGSEALGLCTLGSVNTRVSYNRVHNVLADHYYASHTGSGGSAVASRSMYVWGNVADGPPGNSKGDDGFSIVTYGLTTTVSGGSEFWLNRVFDNVARGMSIVGGDTVNHHDNWAIRCGAAGIYYCSEPAPNDTPTVSQVDYQRNVSYNCGLVTPHRGIHIAGDNGSAPQPNNIVGVGNWSVNGAGGSYLAFNCAASVTSTGLQTTVGSLPAGVTTAAPTNLVYQDTTILRTRDVSYVASGNRPGLYRIHVTTNNGTTFYERFEYIVTGTPTNVLAFVAAQQAAGNYLSEYRNISGVGYALMLTKTPITIGGTVSGVTFAQLRTGDLNGTLSWLWTRVDRGSY